jgi:hypothetical protein
MSAWQIFRPHRWIRRSDTGKSVRFKEVLAAIQSALQTERSGHGRNARLTNARFVVNMPDRAANGGAQTPDT